MAEAAQAKEEANMANLKQLASIDGTPPPPGWRDELDALWSHNEADDEI